MFVVFFKFVFVIVTCCSCCVIFLFFFKQKTAYEMRISDWSSDVCSSDLKPLFLHAQRRVAAAVGALCPRRAGRRRARADRPQSMGKGRRDRARRIDRKSVV